MKSAGEIKGLKIISVKEGKQISTVKDIIIDFNDGRLAYFILNQPSDYFGARLIAYEDILGLGDYALIIPDRGVIQDVAHSQPAVDLLQMDVKVVGCQVLTVKGGLIGEVTEILIEEESGKIAACQINSPNGNTSQVKCSQVIAYGKEIILIGENVQPAAGKTKPEELLKQKIEAFGKKDSLLNDQESLAIIQYPEDFNVFEQRQLQFLQGKTCDRDIPLDTGYLLKSQEQITPEMLAMVKSRSTLMKLTAHVVK